MSDNQNKIDTLFSEKMPGHLRQSILQQAETALAQMAEWANMLASEDGLADNLALAELSDEDMKLLDQLDSLDDLGTISDDEFDFILKEDVCAHKIQRRRLHQQQPTWTQKC